MEWNDTRVVPYEFRSYKDKTLLGAKNGTTRGSFPTDYDPKKIKFS